MPSDLAVRAPSARSIQALIDQTSAQIKDTRSSWRIGQNVALQSLLKTGKETAQDKGMPANAYKKAVKVVGS